MTTTTIADLFRQEPAQDHHDRYDTPFPKLTSPKHPEIEPTMHPVIREAVHAVYALRDVTPTAPGQTRNALEAYRYSAMEGLDDVIQAQMATPGRIHTDDYFLAQAWNALSQAYLAYTIEDDSVLEELSIVMRGEAKRDKDLPPDPHSRYVEAYGMSEMRAYATQFLTDREVYRMTCGRLGDGSKANDTYCAEMYIRSGCNSFVVSRYLQDLFQIQDLSTGELPAPPFPCIWVQAPYSGIEFMSAHTGEPVEMEGFFASTLHAQGEEWLVINLWAGEPEDEELAGTDATLGIRVQKPTNLDDEDLTLEDYLDYLEAQLLDRDHIAHRVMHTEALARVFRLYFHVLLYLDAELAVAQDLYASEIERVEQMLESRRIEQADGSTRRATRKEKVAGQRRLKQITKGTVHLLAPALTKGQAFSEKRLAEPHEGERAQTIVRGHYRMQAYGEGRKLRKRIYIAPHFSPRLESDADYSALLRSKEYVLE